MTELSTTEAWSLLLGVLAPFAVSIVKNPAWSPNVKRYVSIGIAVVIGVLNLIVNTAFLENIEFTVEGVIINLALIVGAAQAAYALLWKPTGATDKVEDATTSTKNTGSV